MGYERPATTIDEKISILESRGLIVSDRQQARRILDAVGYFRLKGYCLAFYGQQYEVFLPGTKLTDVYQVYEFDSALRALMLSACQQIEVRVKAAVGDVLPLKYGPMLSETAFLKSDNWHDWVDSMTLSRRRGGYRKEPFIENYVNKYGEFPLWVDLELITMGSLSIFYSWLSSDARKAIATQFKVPHLFLGNWLHVLTVLRNTCAHNSRLFGRPLTKSVRIHGKFRHEFDAQSCFAIWYILREILPPAEFGLFVFELSRIISRYGIESRLNQIGFPENWRTILLTDLIV